VTATALTVDTFDNRNLNWTGLAELVLAVLITQLEVFRRLFGTVDLTLDQWALSLLPAVLLVFVWELGKLIARRATDRSQEATAA
jgi:Ca2+-transporting ATPase